MDDIDEFLGSIDNLTQPSLARQITLRQEQSQRDEATRLASQAEAASTQSQPQPAKSKDKKSGKRARAELQAAVPLSGAAVEWECYICTLKNEAAAAVCGACGSARDTPTATWVCPTCSYVVPGSAASCGHCGVVSPTSSETVPMPLPAPSGQLQPAPAPLPAEGAAPVATEESGDEFFSDDSSNFSDEEEDFVDVDPAVLGGALDEHGLRDFFANLNTVNHDTLEPANPPATMRSRGHLKDYQCRALSWLKQREERRPTDDQTTRGGMLCDAMGLGKTRTMIALCESNRQHRARDRYVGSRTASNATLIVCPVSLLQHWVDEIKKTVWPPPRILKYHGSGRKKNLFQIAENYDYVLTSFHTLAADYRVYEKSLANKTTHRVDEKISVQSKLCVIRWFRVILDEAHYIRNAKSSQTKACALLVGERRWVVTATPVQNRIGDLFPLLKFLAIPHFQAPVDWRNNIELPISRGKDTGFTRLNLLFNAIMLRRPVDCKAADGTPILQLPERRCIVEKVELSPEERDFYNAVHKNATIQLDVFVRRNTLMKSYTNVFEMLTRCRQACLHPYIVVEAVQRKNARQGQPSTPETAEADIKNEMQMFVDALQRKMKGTAYVKEVLKDVGSGGANLAEAECCVCLDTLQKPTMLPCAHIFCYECIKQCLRATKKCAMCKAPTTDKELHVLPEPKPEESGQAPMLHEISATSNWMRSSRINALLDRIAAIPAEEKIVVFSHYVTFLRYVERVLQQENYTTSLLHGGLRERQRAKLLQEFCESDTPRILLSSVATAGVGLNLTRASRCFMMDPSWNPSAEEQAVNRIYRIGQERPVEIVRFMSPQTVEEQIQKLQKQKLNIAMAALDHKAVQGLTREQILGLFDVPAGGEDGSGEETSEGE